ncbi:MAG: hypothetical protein VKN33_05625 [Candidatus Sericytochromatia bacterium]|nr:hypothetical protein [Candidatus Sericytochromatia bacterium]
MQVHYFLVLPPETSYQPQLEGWLGEMSGAFRHPDQRERMWVITAGPDMARWLEAKIRMEPGTPLVSQGLLVLHPETIEVYQDVPREILVSMKSLLMNVLQRWACRVLSEEGDDWTSRYATHPVGLFEEEDTWHGA